MTFTFEIKYFAKNFAIKITTIEDFEWISLFIMKLLPIAISIEEMFKIIVVVVKIVVHMGREDLILFTTIIIPKFEI